MMKHLLCYSAWCLLAFSMPLLGATLLSVDSNPGKTSGLRITLDKKAQYHVFTLSQPNRLVIDFSETTLKHPINIKNLRNIGIMTMRTGYPKPATLRLVFETKESLHVRTKLAFKDATGPYPLVIEWEENNKTPQVSPLPLKAAVLNKMSPKKSIIVLDPGHGGKDPGAIGPHRYAEKNLTLAIARRLKQEIDKQPGMHAILTRQGDYYIDLRERLAIARKQNADVFISIHADAFVHQHSKGASIFALSPSGATSEAARWLAEKENYSELGGVNLSELDDQNGLVRTVLIDLSQTATIGASLQMGSHILQHLKKITALHNTKVEQARFMVLKSPDIPSILIETGFISNPWEEKKLTSPSYQMELTQAIVAGLKGYMAAYPSFVARA